MTNSERIDSFIKHRLPAIDLIDHVIIQSMKDDWVELTLLIGYGKRVDAVIRAVMDSMYCSEIVGRVDLQPRKVDGSRFLVGVITFDKSATAEDAARLLSELRANPKAHGKPAETIPNRVARELFGKSNKRTW